MSLKDGLLREVLLGMRFGAVGAAATLMHFLALASLLSLGWLGPVLANAVAYVLALGVSFIGHHFWTFRSTAALGPSFARFFGASGAAFLVSTMLLELLIHVVKAADTVAAFLSAASIPVITYAASRFWVFRNRRP